MEATVLHLTLLAGVAAATTTSAGNNGTAEKTVLLPIVNSAMQVTILTILLITALLANLSVILNISRDKLKLKMIHFILIRHVCITDFIGAICILPVPLVVVARGTWEYNSTVCSLISTTTACCWTMHLVAVAMYRMDRVLAVWLPTGKYPLVGLRAVTGVLILTWTTALLGSYSATLIFGDTFQPALALCIPDVPILFFIVLFTGYCLGLIGLTTGYLFAFITRRSRKRRKKFDKAKEVEVEAKEWPLPPPPPLLPPTCSTSTSTSSTSSLFSYTRLSSTHLTHSISLDTTPPRHLLVTTTKSLDALQIPIPNWSIDEKPNPPASLTPLTTTTTATVKIKRYKTPSGRRAILSYIVSIGHLLLYLPAMFVIGLNRGRLEPSTALFCGLVIYCEFIIQPLALIIISKRLRLEIWGRLRRWG